METPESGSIVNNTSLTYQELKTICDLSGPIKKSSGHQHGVYSFLCGRPYPRFVDIQILSGPLRYYIGLSI